MARGHPTDELGRVLPECTWPADKAAPERVDVIRRFCNTCNHENGADRFATIDGLRRWLDEHDPPALEHAVRESDRQRLVEVREHLRAHALAHHDGRADSSFALPLDDRIVAAPVVLDVDDERLAVRPAGGDVAGHTIGVLALAVMEAQLSDSWRRFKACPSCGWVFYDHSKNRTGKWCSMSACGGRAKVAAFRRRTRGLTGEVGA